MGPIEIEDKLWFYVTYMFALIQSKLAFTILHLLSPHTVQCRPELDHQWCRLRHRSSHRRRLFLRPKHP